MICQQARVRVYSGLIGCAETHDVVVDFRATDDERRHVTPREAVTRRDEVVHGEVGVKLGAHVRRLDVRRFADAHRIFQLQVITLMQQCAIHTRPTMHDSSLGNVTLLCTCT